MADEPCFSRPRHFYLKPVKTRQPTDRLFSLFIPINLFLWIQIGVYEIWNRQLDGFSLFIMDFKWNFTEFVVYGMSAVFIVVIFLCILNKMNAEWMIFVIIFYIISIIVGLIVLIVWQTVMFIDLRFNFLLLTLALTVVFFIYHVIIYICTKEVNVKLLAQMIKEPFQAIFNSLMALLLFFVVSFWSIVVLMTTVTIFMLAMPTLGQPNSQSDNLNRTLDLHPGHFTIETFTERSFLWLRLCVFTFGGFFMMNFIWNWGFLIMADYCANFYGTPGNKKVSKTYIYESVTDARYHFGTIAFLSIPILPSTCAIILAFKNHGNLLLTLSKQSGYKLINFVSKICLITEITDYALIETAYYGHNSLKSMRKMFDLHYSNPLVFLGMSTVLIKAMEISILIALTTGMLIQKKYELNATTNVSQIVIDVLLAITYVNLINKFLVRPAICTFLVFKMTGLRRCRT